MTDLPIEPLLDDIVRTLNTRQRLVLAAQTGAGKTTRVPLALAGLTQAGAGGGCEGRILVLEPRRIAARLAAERMASSLGEPVGQRVGLSTRIDRKVSAATRIEVMTDGVFLRRLLMSPDLEGVGAVVFDEVHERGLNVDLGLALALEVQTVLRPDLRLLLMSATLETNRLKKWLDAPLIESEGRQYPTETVYLGRSNDRIEDQMAAAIERAYHQTDASILAFLPGAGEIRRTIERLEGRVDVPLCPLFGALAPDEQDAAIRPPAHGGRKIVLATDIAETSLTIEGISVVVDSGLSRVPDRAQGDGTQRLITVRASKASVDQRRGRAGRLGPGVCYRLWDEPETRGLLPSATPEILTADLSGLVLNLAVWGEQDPGRLNWLEPPPNGRIAAGRETLIALGAMTPDLKLTDKGRAMAELPLSPRLAALVVSARSPQARAVAAHLAVLIAEPGLSGRESDLRVRLQRLENDRSSRALALRQQASRWSQGVPLRGDPGLILAEAWPDRIARRRGPQSDVWLMASGRAVTLDLAEPLARSDWLVVADLSGSAQRGRITQAVAISEQDALEAGHTSQSEDAIYDPETRSFKARQVTKLGEIILTERPLPKPSAGVAKDAYLAHIAAHGFSDPDIAQIVHIYCARLAQLRTVFGEIWPDVSSMDLQLSVHDWLGDRLADKAFKIPDPETVKLALMARLDWQQARRLEDDAPLMLKLPSGRRAPINWLDDRAPLVEGRVQEFYGCRQHPSLADGRLPVTLQLLSPGGKPTATTRDLSGFWTSGYFDMAKDMRGRYPKHDWPDQPAEASPHAGLTKARLAKPR
ncbi:MAG: ATP-dependent helicase HrpB [Henriciella sp.]